MRTKTKNIHFSATKFIVVTSIALINIAGHSIYASENAPQSEVTKNLNEENIVESPPREAAIFIAQTESEKSEEQSTGISIEKSADKEQPVQLGRVEVTGTHIKRTDIEGPSSVLIFDREKIDQTGSTSVSELLRKLPMNYGESFDEKYGYGFSPGSSGMSIRGLGQENTLVLLNGQRLANYGFAQNISNTFVNLNSIPISAVERVEILKDGASAIYGSDAIAGVINIILRKDFEGTEIAATYGETSYGDGNEAILSLVSGWNTAKSNLTVVIDYFNRSAISRADRDFSKNADHTSQGGIDFTSPANYPSNVFDLVDPNNVIFTGFYNYNEVMTLIPATERLGAIANYTLELTPELTLFSELGYNQSTTDFVNAPTAVFPEDFQQPIPGTHPDNPFPPNPTIAYWRMTEWGNRETETTTDNGRIVVGLKGIMAEWDWEAAANYNRSKTVMDGRNYVQLSALETGVFNGTINPFGTTPNSQAAIDSTRVSIQRTGISELYGIDAKTTGEVAQLNAGPVYLALGAGWRNESLEDTPDSLSEQGDIVGSAGTSTKGDRDVGSAFAEFNVPVIDQIEMQLAIRYENYSDFGDATSPKVGLSYKPTNGWLLRGSWGQGFRAPSLPELNLGLTTAFDVVIDPVTGNPAFTAVTLQGNPDLDATDSESWNLGALWEPVNDFTIEVNYWNYDIENNIEAVEPQYLVDNEASLPPGVIVRDPVTNEIVQVNTTFQNISSTQTDGLDIDVRYRWNTAAAGTFTIGVLANYLLSYDQQPFSGAPSEDLVSTYRYPKWRAVLPVGWYRGDYGASIAANYIDSYDDILDPTLTVDSLLTWDIQFVYLGIRNSTVTLGVKNLTNEDPPYANEPEGYDYATHDPRGRFLYGTFAYKF
jgi:iron complex outermembrane receptor protein